MLCVVIGTALIVMFREGSPIAIMEMASVQAPALGQVAHQPLASYLGSFVIWAAAIPVIPHIVMRVFTAKDAHGARISLNVAMILYSLMILAAVFTIVPVGKIHFPDLQDADKIFLQVMQQEFPPLVRGLAVAAVLAAVMSTTDALLLACSSAISHDLLGKYVQKNLSEKAGNYLNVAIAWAIGLVAMYLAYSPPPLITQFYSAAIGLLTAALFVPVMAGLWWKKANLAGGIASLVIGVVVYLFFQFSSWMPPLSAILVALPASALAMVIGSKFGQPAKPEMVENIERLHR
jgi:Na+/proline symporter